MLKHHPQLNLPDANRPIWRYMSFAKFVCMLQTRRLYFATRGELTNDDKWEGVYPLKKAQRAARAAWEFEKKYSPSKIDKMADAFGEQQVAKLGRFGVNCWHLSDFESAAMWKVYGDNSQAVAVESTVGRLVETVSTSDHDVWIGEVEYFQPPKYDPPIEEVVLSLFRKMACFTYEAEVRAAIELTDLDIRLKKQQEWPGIDVPLDTLIEKVRISPRAQKWFMTTVHQELVKYGLPHVDVFGSYMDVDPDY
jgi:hypothetical protein